MSTNRTKLNRKLDPVYKTNLAYEPSQYTCVILLLKYIKVQLHTPCCNSRFVYTYVYEVATTTKIKTLRKNKANNIRKYTQVEQHYSADKHIHKYTYKDSHQHSTFGYRTHKSIHDMQARRE